MKLKIFSIFLCTCISLCIAEAATYTNNTSNVLYIKDAVCISGKTVELAVALKNNVSISGFQFDLYLPTGITIATETDAYGDDTILTSFDESRGNPTKFTYMSSFPVIGDRSHLRVLCYSMDKTLSGNDGIVTTIRLNVASTVLDGIYDIKLKDTSVSNSTDTYVNTNVIVGMLNVSAPSSEQRDVIMSDGSLTSFSVDQDEDVASITYTRNFKNTGWQEFYVPFAISYEDWKNDFDIGYIEGFLSRDLDNNGTIDETVWSGVMITEGTLLPNTPYIIRAKTTGNKTITLNNTTLYATEENSIDCSSTTMRYIFKGVYESENFGSAEDYPYYLNNGMFNRVPRIVPFRWTLRFESRGTSFVIHPNLTRGFVRENDGSPFEEYVKNNPELFAGYKVFTLDGRMIDMTTKTLKPGFYVKNGKKILVK